MKERCSICLKDKARRECKLKEDAKICSRCCAETRIPDCGGCLHYVQSEKYAVEKIKNAGPKGFIARIDPEVDEAVGEALELVEKGKIAKAEKLIKDLLNKHPDIYTVQYAMGTVQAMKGDFADSIIYFDKSVEIFPYCLEAWLNRGMSYIRMADIGNAVKSLQKVIEFGNKDEELVITARERLRDLEDVAYKGSGLTLSDYVKSSDEFAQAFSAMNARNYDKAIKGFNKVLSFDKNHVQSHGNLGLCYAYLGEKSKALAAFDRALALDPAYEPAIGNKKILLSLKEGEKMEDIQFASIEYYRETFYNKKN